jgi:hypothetical protein
MLQKLDLDIEPEAFDDIQKTVNYYNNKKSNLGKRFFTTVDKHFEFLKKNYLSFAVRYDSIRCMPVEKFPYMIHYRILEQQELVSAKAVFCTYEDSEKWEKRKKSIS